MTCGHFGDEDQIVMIDVENHLSNRRIVPHISVVNERLISVPWHNVVGIVDCWGDNRFDRLIGSNVRFTEKVDNDASCYYLIPCDTLLVRGMEMSVTYGNCASGHVVAFGLPGDAKLPVKMPVEDFQKAADDLRAVKILGDTTNYKGLRRYLEEHIDVWEEFDAMKVWSASVNPISPRQNNHAQKLYERMCDFHKKGYVATSDGHSVPEIFGSYNEARLNWNDFLNSGDNVVKNLGGVMSRFSEYSARCRPAFVRSLIHAGWVGWDHVGKKLLPGFTMGDPFAPDYVPGWLEEKIQEVIGPFRI